MSEPIAFHDLPAELFPFRIEALHPITGAVVWSRLVERPPDDQKEAVFI